MAVLVLFRASSFPKFFAQLLAEVRPVSAGWSLWPWLLPLKNKWTNDKRLYIFTKYEKDIGGRHISVDFSAPSILQSRVWIPRTLSTLLYSQILYYICHCIEERTEINKRRPGLVTCFKNPHLWKIWKSLRRSVPDDNFVLQIVDLAVFVTVLLKIKCHF